MLLKLLEHPLNGLYVFFAFAFDVDEDVIKVHYHKNVKFFYQDLIDIALECSRCVSQSKRYDLVLEVAIAGLEDRFPCIAFPDPHSMVCIGQIKLDKMSSPT